ncbi:KTSC domain-containing protein [Naasia lichenicola]|uniref:KTSC domain-containing protein n=1 Tax=Naasia lichenicola TaxID=2565933 RepID=A0A4S4FSZ0_9MICO|nr:KTSC domain-containing protein [Naasia lichenicola]THG33534.1 KTSC domain-containing protein [Naasia lichenicola]
MAPRTAKAAGDALTVDMVRVESDSLRAVGYDHGTGTLRVAFRNGGLYDYYDVPADLFEALLAPHSWRRLSEQVKDHRYRRIDG